MLVQLQLSWQHEASPCTWPWILHALTLQITLWWSDFSGTCSTTTDRFAAQCTAMACTAPLYIHKTRSNIVHLLYSPYSHLPLSPQHNPRFRLWCSIFRSKVCPIVLWGNTHLNTTTTKFWPLVGEFTSYISLVSNSLVFISAAVYAWILWNLPQGCPRFKGLESRSWEIWYLFAAKNASNSSPSVGATGASFQLNIEPTALILDQLDLLYHSTKVHFAGTPTVVFNGLLSWKFCAMLLRKRPIYTSSN
jgi:hypothetical protein